MPEELSWSGSVASGSCVRDLLNVPEWAGRDIKVPRALLMENLKHATEKRTSDLQLKFAYILCTEHKLS